ncbi:MAG: 4-hydroxythreonine-4-phosphate dehydrogenase PdxA [Salibacteraceae bacterium]|nr:4-hydroxythreonine-4-phosphate dehydrogenase PdxA [Salibacteraceae bacterium]|tara:strand:+ start:26343 stop:27401 length:1059 start_codon:yes stop_codon:yes gene_type:complete
MHPKKNIKPNRKIRVGVSIGDYNGIGLEVIIKTFSDARMMDVCTPVIYGNLSLIKAYNESLDVSDFSFLEIADAAQANPKRANLVQVWDDESTITFGESTSDAGRKSFLSLEAATKDLASNKIDVLVTAPINKNNIQSEDFSFPGHTEYLANYANEDYPLMVLTHGDLRVGTITGHIAIKDVASQITEEVILKKIEVLQKTLQQDFSIAHPTIAVLGLNPHSGDNGTIGSEEKEIIIPALKKAEKQGTLIFGPFPADGFFGSPGYKKFDGILAMYHDQGLTPFKTISFDEGVNFTAGLPIVRTSPDHGTAYDIAGAGIASASSFRNAVFSAIDIFKNRKLNKTLVENALTKR